MCNASTESVVDAWSYNEILCLDHSPQFGSRCCSSRSLAVAAPSSVARNHLEMWRPKYMIVFDRRLEQVVNRFTCDTICRSAQTCKYILLCESGLATYLIRRRKLCHRRTGAGRLADASDRTSRLWSQTMRAANAIPRKPYQWVFEMTGVPQSPPHRLESDCCICES
jgi:hypothetical protein